MKKLFLAAFVLLGSPVFLGCSDTSENAVAPAPELTNADFERRAEEEEAEQRRLRAMP